jgi:hypothetical protein
VKSGRGVRKESVANASKRPAGDRSSADPGMVTSGLTSRGNAGQRTGRMCLQTVKKPGEILRSSEPKWPPARRRAAVLPDAR